jgi:hypothetical protein
LAPLLTSSLKVTYVVLVNVLCGGGEELHMGNILLQLALIGIQNRNLAKVQHPDSERTLMTPAS